MKCQICGIKCQMGAQWLSGIVIDSRPRAAGLSLTGITALCHLARHIDPSLVLVQPRKTHPYITERLLMGRKESNQTHQTNTTNAKILPSELLEQTLAVIPGNIFVKILPEMIYDYRMLKVI